MQKHLSKQEAEEALKKAQERLTVLETDWPMVELTIQSLERQLAERKESLVKNKKEVDERRTEIANLRNTLGTYQQAELVASGNDEDFLGCPHEWQREVIVFLRRQPGVPIHFSAMLTLVDKKLPSDVFTKNRSAMLNLMGHLITKKLVAKGKNGNYSWAVFPKDWKAPAPVLRIAPTTPTQDDQKEALAERLFTGILSGKEWIQKELENHFHRLCIEQGFSQNNADAFRADAQFIEEYMYRRAQPGCQIVVYKNDDRQRQAAELSEHLLISAGRVVPKGPWVRVEKPTTRQPAIDTKRKGGSVP